MIRAVIFDFDGLILETDEPTFKSWQAVYRSFEQPPHFRPSPAWSAPRRVSLTPPGTGKAGQEDRLGAVEPRRREVENGFIEAQPTLPGADQYLRDARRLDLKIGLASNSPCDWVTRHLTRIGLLDCFDFMSTSDRVQNIKPHPELYLSALQGLGVGAGETFALEDSPIGIRSAKAAGLYCVAVPNILTSRLDLSQADYWLPSLAEMPLEELLERIGAD
jgi:HAD superfamily hydrolase (TIGR01509 family)